MHTDTGTIIRLVMLRDFQRPIGLAMALRRLILPADDAFFAEPHSHEESPASGAPARRVPVAAFRVRRPAST
ncbi:hypothetical protein WKW77_02555 [Variovorax ureilyticus]|uniref:Uncharacterized protein n=1 Tax=Variovorax ureilyticus TaxID=1836198 RepID=A0ABU8V8G7_9BURK